MATEQVKSRIYRVLSNATEQVWDKISFWTKAYDVECSDGDTVEDKIGSDGLVTYNELAGITSAGAVPDALAVKQLNSNLNNVNLYVGDDKKLHFVNSGGADTVLNFNSEPTLIGSYSGDTSINISNYIKPGDTVKNFLIEATGINGVWSTVGYNPSGGQSYDVHVSIGATTITKNIINNTTLQITGATGTGTHFWGGGRASVGISHSITYNVYYI